MHRHGSRTAHVSQCAFCNKSLEGGYRYLYPVPAPFEDPVKPSQVGKRACLKCAPALIEAQFAQGLVVKGRAA